MNARQRRKKRVARQAKRRVPRLRSSFWELYMSREAIQRRSDAALAQWKWLLNGEKP